MSNMQNIEARIKRLEEFVYGQTSNQLSDDQIIDSLLSTSHKLAIIVSKNDKVSNLLKRADEIMKYSDPLYLESDALTLEPIQHQLLLSKEDELKEGLEQLKKLQKLTNVLDSQAIQGVTDLQQKLQGIIINQENQEETVKKLTGQTYSVLQDYHDFVNKTSLNLAEISKKSNDNSSQ